MYDTYLSRIVIEVCLLNALYWVVRYIRLLVRCALASQVRYVDRTTRAEHMIKIDSAIGG
jgi:hypothetical protein